MSELFGIAGAMLKNYSTNRLMSQDIIHEARGQMMRPYAVRSAEVDLAPTCALSGNLLLHSMEQRNYIRLLEHRLVAFAQRMGEHRVCETAHMVFERMEAAWQLQQEACCIVGTKYDNVLDKLMILASDVGLDIAGASNSPDDIFAGLTNSWQEARENAKKIATALDIETANIQDLAAHMNVVSSDIDSNILDHLKVRWNEKEAEVIDLQERLAGESQKANEAEGILKRVVDMMGMAGSTIGSTLFGAIRTPWTQLQAKVNDLETALLQERVKSAKTKENLQDLANFCGVDQTPGNESTLLASIKDKWKETQEKVSQQELSLQTEMEKNRTNMKDMQDLAAFMGVAPCEGDKVPLADMKSKWLESRAEVTDLQEALRQEREKSRRAEEALQIHLQKTSPMTSSVSIQTDVTEIHQRTKVQSVSPVEIEQPTSSNCDSPATLSPPLQTSDELQRLAHGAIPKMSRVKAEEATPKNLPQRIVGGAPTESNESLSQTPPFLGARGNSREEEELCELSSGCEGLASDVMVVSSMADITAWDETTDRIELGCGAVATVFLCRHANTKRPVALKVGWHLSVFCPDEVRIHSALSGLPWFPAFYGSFKMADGQTALAMEFFGSEAECRSYTVADCLNTEGPHLSRTDWFDVIIDVAEGLQAMHDRGYLYNDLKVDNVLVTKQEDIWRGKLIDFGISSDTSSPFEVPVDDELIEEYESTGECGHIAPECVLEGMPCSTSTDVYALGKLLMVIGRERAQCYLLCYGTEICGAEWNQRPRLEEVITKLYNLQLHEGEEDDADSSSC